jgi:hypothetical protein
VDRADDVAFGVSECAGRIDTTTVVNRCRGNRHRESRRGHAESEGVHCFDLGGSSTRFEIEMSAYDCEFVALAHANGVRLLTVDRQILHEFPEVANSLKRFVQD